MTARRWSLGHVVAVVELLAAVLAAAWFVGLGLQAEASLAASDRSALDRAAPFVLGAAVAVGLGALALRSWRTAERAAQRGAASPPPPAQPPPADPPAPAPAPAPGPVRQPPAELSPEGRRELARVVAVLADAGVLAPRAPDPAQLREAAADYGEPVTAESVLRAIEEADWYHPGFVAADYSANLAFHASHTEQWPGVLQGQADDLVRLAGGGPAVTARVEEGSPDGARIPVLLRLAVDGEEQLLGYAGAAKYLSTVLHVALARTLRQRGADHRLAWLWSDQGVWLTGLGDGGVERLNAELAHPAAEEWAWVDEQRPHAAGEAFPAAGS